MRIRKMPLGNANMIGERVEQLRNINNMKQKDLLYLLNSKGIVMTASSLSKLEGQVRQVNDFEIVALADIFGISVSKLLGIEQNIINEKFGEFLSGNLLNSQQQEFVKAIIGFFMIKSGIWLQNIVNNE